MNVNCPRDPLTCRCDYHAGRVEAPPHSTGCGYPERGCSCEVLRMIGNADGRESSWVRTRITEAGDNVTEGFSIGKPAPWATRLAAAAERPPIAPGVLLDDEPASFYARLRRPRDWYGIRRLAARWAGALAMVVGAAAIMYAEGQRQPAPGVGFGIALALLMGAALLLPLGRSNDG